MTFYDPHNTFRHGDASEYIDAYRACISLNAAQVRQKLNDLSERIGRQGDNPPTYLLAAYRGYEDALAFKEQMRVPSIVKVNDLDPTPCV
jgi:hypothetical protein